MRRHVTAQLGLTLMAESDGRLHRRLRAASVARRRNNALGRRRSPCIGKASIAARPVKRAKSREHRQAAAYQARAVSCGVLWQTQYVIDAETRRAHLEGEAKEVVTAIVIDDLYIGESAFHGANREL